VHLSMSDLRIAMSPSPSKKEREIAEFAFNGVAFSLLGYCVLIALYVRHNLSPLYGLLWTLPPLLILGVSLRRCRHAWPGLAQGKGLADYLTFKGTLDAPNVSSAFLLLICGFFLGYIACVGGLVFVGVCAVAASTIPWWKFRLVHEGFFVACFALCLGTLPPLFFMKTPVVWVQLAFAAWAFFMVAVTSTMTAAWRTMKIQKFAKQTAQSPVPTPVR
jgi:hypothetical protein